MTTLIIFLQAASAQDESLLFRSDKIYAVLAVMLIVWLGAVAHMIWLNRKIGQLERQLPETPDAPESSSRD